MFKGDKTLRGAGEKILYTPEMMEEFIKCKEDIVYFAEKYFKIVTIDDGEIRIKLHDFQKKILKAFVGNDGDDRRHCALAASRQCGKCQIFSSKINILINNKRVDISIGEMYILTKLNLIKYLRIYNSVKNFKLYDVWKKLCRFSIWKKK